MNVERGREGRREGEREGDGGLDLQLYISVSPEFEYRKGYSPSKCLELVNFNNTTIFEEMKEHFK